MKKKLCYLIQCGNFSPDFSKVAYGSDERCQLWLVERDKFYNYNFTCVKVNLNFENYENIEKYKELPLINNSNDDIDVFKALSLL